MFDELNQNSNTSQCGESFSIRVNYLLFFIVVLQILSKSVMLRRMGLSLSTMMTLCR